MFILRHVRMIRYNIKFSTNNIQYALDHHTYDIVVFPIVVIHSTFEHIILSSQSLYAGLKLKKSCFSFTMSKLQNNEQRVGDLFNFLF